MNTNTLSTHFVDKKVSGGTKVMLQINLFLITLNVVGMKNIGGFAVSKMVLEDNAFVSSI